MNQESEENVGSATLAAPINWRDHMQGPQDAPFKLVQYGDYECPACGEAYPILKAVQSALGERLCFVFRNFPLTDIHPHAEHAAEAAEAADEQGRFWAMHDVLHENQGALDDKDLARYASALRLDARELLREVQTSAHRDRVAKDFQGGVSSGVNGTPTFFVNGIRHHGPWNADILIAELTGASVISL